MALIRPPVMPMATNMHHVAAFNDVGQMPARGEDEQEAARVLYVAATRATQRLVMGWVGMADLERCQ